MSNKIYRPAANTGTAWPFARRPDRNDPSYMGSINLLSQILTFAVWPVRKNDERVASAIRMVINTPDRSEVAMIEVPKFVRKNGERRPSDPAFYGVMTAPNGESFNVSVWINLFQKEGQPDKPYISVKCTPHQTSQAILLLG